jgi:hypothetical protein
MPILIPQALRRAIDARTRCTSWFQSKSDGERGCGEAESTAKHSYFINILQDALTILTPCFQKQKTTFGARANSDGIGLSNRFDRLEIQDLDDQDLESLFTSTTKAGSRSSAKVDKVECDLSIDTDLPFLIFCFYEDLECIRGLIRETWTRFAAGELDLTTASLTTNLAIGIARKAEEDIQNLAPLS